MMVRTADHAEVQEPWNMPIGVERGDASNVPCRVGPLPRLTDLLEVIFALIGEVAFAYFHRSTPYSDVRRSALLLETDNTAWMIGS